MVSPLTRVGYVSMRRWCLGYAPDRCTAGLVHCVQGLAGRQSSHPHAIPSSWLCKWGRHKLEQVTLVLLKKVVDFFLVEDPPTEGPPLLKESERRRRPRQPFRSAGPAGLCPRHAAPYAGKGMLDLMLFRITRPPPNCLVRRKEACCKSAFGCGKKLCKERISKLAPPLLTCLSARLIGSG